MYMYTCTPPHSHTCTHTLTHTLTHVHTHTLTHPRAPSRSDHRMNLFTYRQCSSGRKMVDFVLTQSSAPRSRPQVVQMWQSLLTEGVLDHGETMSHTHTHTHIHTHTHHAYTHTPHTHTTHTHIHSEQRASISRRRSNVLPFQ